MSHSPTRTLGFGICGLGLVADFHAQAIARVEGARLAGVASRDAAKARAFADKHGAPFAGDLASLLARPEVDVVCITTASGAHLEPALAAIRAGKHVVVEKPLEITVERVDRILAEARKAGVRVAPIFQSRFGEGARTVKAAIAAGRFGRLVLASAYVKWQRTSQYYAPPRGVRAYDGGGALMNQAIHGLDLLQWLAGMPEEVAGWTTRRVHTGIEVEDTACAALRYAGGALGAIEATTASWPGWQRRIEICGEHGSVALEDDHIARWDFREARPEDEAVRAAKDRAALGSGASAPNAISTLGHQLQLQDLADALRAGREPALTGEEGRRAVALVCALYASAERGGQPVKVPA
jgi:UDP-N-acetyl-2-amino-2-deoxyglucuronate dehydrogenase